jgi:hypothetical protein
MGSTDMGLPGPRPLRRREFLVGTLGAAAGAIAVGAATGSAATAPAAVGGVALSAPRAATYRALLAALAHAPDGRFRHAAPAPATAALARWYAGQSPAVRHHVDTVLDLLHTGGPPRYEQLARPVACCADATSARHRAAVAAGIELAALAVAPASPPGERPVTAPLPVALRP